MSRLFTFLKDSDADSIRRSHRRRAKEIATSMSKRTSSSREVPAATSSLQRSVKCTPVSTITGRELGPSLVPTAGSRPHVLEKSIYSRSAEEDTVQALMDLSLPRFTKLADGVILKTEPWPVTERSPASPVSVKDGYQVTTNSPCMILDDIYSCSSVGDTSPCDFKVTRLYDSEDSITPVGSIVFSSDEDVPLSSGQEDRRKVRKRDPRPMNQSGPTEVPEYEPLPRERPGDVPVHEPTPWERPVDDPKLRGRSVDDKAYEPMPRNKPVADPTLRERPVDGPMPRNRLDDVRACEPMPRIKPVDDPTLRERPVDEQLSRNRLNDVPPYEPTLRERPVDDPKLRGWSVDVKAYEPMPRKKPVDVPTLRERPVDEQMSRNRLDDVPPYEPTTRERPVDDLTHKGTLVDDQGCELMTIERPVDVLVYEPTPRERPVDVPQLRGRLVDNQTYEPMKKEITVLFLIIKSSYAITGVCLLFFGKTQ